VDFDESNALLGHIAAQRRAMPAVNHTHETLKIREPKQHIRAVLAVARKIASFRVVSETIDPGSETARRWLKIDELMLLEHLLDFVRRRARYRLGQMTAPFDIAVEQLIDIGLIEE